MKIFLTKGMFGEKIQLVDEVDLTNLDEKEIRIKFWDSLSKFKTDKSNKDRYRMTSYDRIIQSAEDPTLLAIDFGDYSWFLLAEEVPNKTLFP